MQRRVLGHHSQVAPRRRRSATYPRLAGTRARIRMLDEPPERLTPSARRIDVQINITGRSPVTCAFPVQRSAWWRLDNCHLVPCVNSTRSMSESGTMIVT